MRSNPKEQERELNCVKRKLNCVKSSELRKHISLGDQKKKTPHGWSGMNKGRKKLPENQIMKDNIKDFHFYHKDNENFERFYAWSIVTPLPFCIITPGPECHLYA